MGGGGLSEVTFRELRVSLVTSQVSEGCQGISILVVQLQNLGEGVASGVLLAELLLQVSVIQKRTYAGRSERQSFFQVFVGGVEVTRCRFDCGP